MLPASNRGVGISFHFPDVCKTPVPPAVVPVPYPCIAFQMQAVPFSPNIYVGYVPATNMGSSKLLTAGMEAGVGMGVVSQTIKGSGQTLIGDLITFYNCLPAERLLVPTAGNNYNAPVGSQIVPSITVTFITMAEMGAAAGVSSALLDDLARLKDGDAVSSQAQLSTSQPSTSAAGRALQVRIALFQTDVGRQVYNVIAASDDPVVDLVIDLRGNRGGDADAALALAAEFLPAGTLLAEAVEDDGDVETIVSWHAQVYTMPLTLLVDAGTASAAELFAAVLQHHGRARVIGERTYGKATAQQLCTAVGEQARYQTVRHYRLPNGEHWHGLGLTPDPPQARTARS